MKGRNYPPYYDASLVKSREQMFAAFDTETDGLGGELLLVTWAIAGEEPRSGIIEGNDMIGALIDVMKANPRPIWYAHNAQYDWRYFMSYIKDNKLDHQIFMRTKTDIYQIKLFFPIEGSKKRLIVTMRDSMAFWPGKLSDLLTHYAPDLPKLAIDNIAHFNPNNPEHRAYAERDSVGLAVAMRNLDAMIRDQYGVGLKGTTASTAMAAWEAQIDRKYYINETNEKFIREAYFGGLVFLRNTRVNYNLETYDINSSYPDKMRRFDLPYGRSYHVTEYHGDKLGIYRVILKTNNVTLPCIPKRLESGGIIWPVGTFETVTTNVELEFALTHGYEILDILDGIIFEEALNPFAPFVDKCETIRNSFKGMPQETLAKLIQNSLYGKFGTRRERVTMFVPMNDEDIRDAEPWDEDQYWWVKTEEQDIRCMPAWAVFITAYARLHLLHSAYDVGIGNVVYGDTDSLTMKTGHAERLSVGSRYGQFKLEKEWATFRAIAPKVYVGTLATSFKRKQKGAIMGAAKGLPDKKMMFCKWWQLMRNAETEVTYETLSSLKVQMKHATIGTRMVSRRSSDIGNSLGWVSDGQGNVWPRLLETG